jgi:hypothetical protein
MPDQSGLKRSNAERAKDAREKAKQAISLLKAERIQVNFSTVAMKSGVSRNYLYRNPEIRSLIEEQRKCDVDNEINRRARYDKTARSKDVIISAKDKRIARLEEENRHLKEELLILRGLVYGTNKSTAITCNRREESNDTGG